MPRASRRKKKPLVRILKGDKGRRRTKKGKRNAPIVHKQTLHKKGLPKKMKAHPRVHVGMDGDKPSYANNFKDVKVKHMGQEKLPKIKQELKVKELKEIEQVRGVHKVPEVVLSNTKEEPSKDSQEDSKEQKEPRQRSVQGPFPTVVLCGLGFGGLTVAKSLKQQFKGKGRIIGIDCSDRFMFIPGLMALAGGFFTREEISAPLQSFADKMGMEFIHDSIVSIDTKNRVVHTKTKEVPYDYVVIGLGAASTPLPPGFDEKTLALRHIWDAQDIWKSVTLAADVHGQDSGRKSFEVPIGIIGGGATGIQLASWVKDGLQFYLNKKYARGGKVSITVFQSGPDLVPGVPVEARKAAFDLLQKQGVRVALNAKARGCVNNVITMEDGSVHSMDAVVFCGGWRQSPVINSMGISFDDRKGITSSTFMQSIDDPYVFVIGDALNFVPEDINIAGWKRAQNARLVANVLGHNILAHSRSEAMVPFEVKDTPIILDLRPKSILIRNGKTSVGRIWWHVAQWIRRINLFIVRHPKIPIPY